MYSKKHLTRLLVAGAFLASFSSTASAATCQVSDLAGTWDGVINETSDYTGTYYCKNIKVSSTGKVASKGTCRGTSLRHTGSTLKEKVVVKIVGGRLRLNSNCSLDVSGSNRSYMLFQEVGENDPFKDILTAGTYNKVGKTIIIFSDNEDGSFASTLMKR